MLSPNKLKKYIQLETNDIVLETIEDNVIYRAVLFDFIERAILANPSLKSDIRPVINSYKSIKKAQFLNYKLNAITYTNIVNFIKSENITSFMELNQFQHNYIIGLFGDKQSKERLSLKRYSPLMYSVRGLTNAEDERLSKLHWNLVVPLIKSIIQEYPKVDINDVNIKPVKSKDYPVGRALFINITTLSNTQLLRSIKNNRVIFNYIHEVEIVDDYVRLIIK